MDGSHSLEIIEIMNLKQICYTFLFFLKTSISQFLLRILSLGYVAKEFHVVIWVNIDHLRPVRDT